MPEWKLNLCSQNLLHLLSCSIFIHICASIWQLSKEPHVFPATYPIVKNRLHSFLGFILMKVISWELFTGILMLFCLSTPLWQNQNSSSMQTKTLTAHKRKKTKNPKTKAHRKKTPTLKSRRKIGNCTI